MVYGHPQPSNYDVLSAIFRTTLECVGEYVGPTCEGENF